MSTYGYHFHMDDTNWWSFCTFCGAAFEDRYSFSFHFWPCVAQALFPTDSHMLPEAGPTIPIQSPTPVDAPSIALIEGSQSPPASSAAVAQSVILHPPLATPATTKKKRAKAKTAGAKKSSVRKSHKKAESAKATCPTCLRTFSRAPDLTRHRETVHRSGGIEAAASSRGMCYCTVPGCGLLLSRGDALARHLRTVHRD
ncbi:hypothetical protein EXIGLDRAFT_777060 [Exidia glandulosa HHB12029]|uniref:C2H2-type domain-containing protein n=1 Tax=Exidia glandulosa HHB12029 TaxID=1314781 RepID=A0A165D765_EXIGL|nr:hypothetical protein EXIGLDRAFT_777060 [Exidia glandulosa HHB12029]